MKNKDYFKSRVKHYFYDVFHIYEMELTFDSIDSDENRSFCLWHDIDKGAMDVTVFYDKEWIKEAGKEEIDKVAFHEVCEILLWELNELTRARFISEKDIPNAVHRIIHRLENTIWEKVR